MYADLRELHAGDAIRRVSRGSTCTTATRASGRSAPRSGTADAPPLICVFNATPVPRDD